MASILLEKKDHIAIVTLNNPHNLNALNPPFLNEIEKVIDEIDQDKDIFVMIITGTERAFIAGADIKSMLASSAIQMFYGSKQHIDLTLKIENLRIPVIAALNGFTFGGGCETAMACDIRIASDKAQFGQPEVGLGITPGAGGTQRLPRLVGLGKAKELIYTGKAIKAEEAERIGLVNMVVPHDSLMDECIKMAKQIIANAQIAVQQSKRCINFGMQADVRTGLEVELQAFSLCNATEDKQIGMSAFVNKSKEKNFVYR